MSNLGYDRAPVTRFLLLAFPLLVLILAVGSFAAELLGYAPVPGSMLGAAMGLGALPGKFVVGSWLLESAGLIAFFLVAYGQSSRWFAGIVSGWLAWVFRGPLVVLTVVGAAGMKADSWWRASLVWLVLYTICGLVLAFLSLRMDKRRAEKKRSKASAEPAQQPALEPAPEPASELAPPRETAPPELPVEEPEVPEPDRREAPPAELPGSD